MTVKQWVLSDSAYNSLLSPGWHAFHQWCFNIWESVWK